MNSFKETIKEWDDFNFNDFLEGITPKAISELLVKEKLNSIDFLKLLSPAANEFLETIAQKANEITSREFGKTVQIYTPLYISNYCSNNCLYCGFKLSNNIERSKLTLKQIEQEALEIRALGIKHILLLTGGDRGRTPFSYIKDSVEIAKRHFDSISIEMYAMSFVEYKELMTLGVDNITIYQETYNNKCYKRVHPSGEKSDYNFRLEAPERAAEAGARSVNIGVLLGLDEPIKDIFITALHAERILKNFPGCDIGISLPRIKEATGNFKVDYLVDDLLLSKMIMAFRIFIPRAAISISTREGKSLRDNLLPLGVTKMSAESKTTVGGYHSKESDPQFETADKRTVSELEKDLEIMGYQPVYKDWVLI